MLSGSVTIIAAPPRARFAWYWISRGVTPLFSPMSVVIDACTTRLRSRLRASVKGANSDGYSVASVIPGARASRWLRVGSIDLRARAFYDFRPACRLVREKSRELLGSAADRSRTHR